MTLTTSQARSYYDRFGKKQDAQSFYEDPALEALIAHADFEHANSVFEFGCGTGRFGLQLITKHLSQSASYVGTDVSTTMIDIATERLSPHAPRAKVGLSDGSVSFPVGDRSVDHVVSTYVLDLLPETAIREAIGEAHRVLTENGKLCLVSLTEGSTFASRLVSGIWSTIYRMSASLVGGCRPIQLEQFIDIALWSIDYRGVVTPFGVPSEILVATPTNA